MKLTVAAAIGRGRTELAAFDNALVAVGAANFNLVRLSSVIPPHSTVVEAGDAPPPAPGTWGDRLYVVYAESRTSIRGMQVWAGVGWVQDTTDGRGLFVEHEGDDESTVRVQIETSLEDVQTSRGVDLGPLRMRLAGGVCVDRPVCALVLCCYGSEPWSSR
jgi:arginine decarboxylase